ncbi:flocculation protein [Rhynchospora pubera]|uniref:Flocculation protein n=1 Tax=Rhynchospora pubera TaxID=906938 RepID=A0AAV8EZ78_9POAL|nr:flocculation protein [Rhynchospora pubera]KAJ4807663.1 flocculation protein [Rhynchospora pubera]
MDSSRSWGNEEEEEEHDHQEEDEGPSALQWLRALQVHSMGACRSDDLSFPLPSSCCLLSPPPLPLLLLRLCNPSPAAQNRLLAHLTQLLDLSQIGLLLRCLCAPLVSIRVGKINRLPNLLCPIPSRGRLNLNMAPSSWLQISFVGDDSGTEQLYSISCNSCEVDRVIIEQIAADTSGRSFLVKLSDSQVFYYWLSEKSLSHGLHLLDKMNDLLRRRPTLSDLTGISSSCLDLLGTHLQACLVSPNLAEAQSIHSESAISTCPSSENARFPYPQNHRTSILGQASSISSSSPSSKGGGSLSPRGKTCFKDHSSSLSSLRIGRDIRDSKLKKRHGSLLAIPSLPFNHPAATGSPPPSSVVAGLSADLPPDFAPFNPLTFQFPLPPPDHASSIGKQPLFKPQYCWCPMGPSRVPSALPPLAVSPQVSAPNSLSLGSAASSELPKVLHDPLVHLPLPISSLVIPPLPGSSQFPAFTGLMSDPIVHLPVMDIRSSGQAYLVSAGPAMSTAIPPLVVKPLVPTMESVIEKNARETLMRLLESAPMPNPVHAVAFGVGAISSAISSMELDPSLEDDMSSQAEEQGENEQEQEQQIDN